jgi:hypothetical protein
MSDGIFGVAYGKMENKKKWFPLQYFYFDLVLLL